MTTGPPVMTLHTEASTDALRTKSLALKLHRNEHLICRSEFCSLYHEYSCQTGNRLIETWTSLRKKDCTAVSIWFTHQFFLIYRSFSDLVSIWISPHVTCYTIFVGCMLLVSWHVVDGCCITSITFPAVLFPPISLELCGLCDQSTAPSPWRSLIVLDLRCLQEIDLNHVDKFLLFLLNYHSSLDGVDLWMRRFGTFRICHALRTDLTGQWISRDLIWWNECGVTAQHTTELAISAISTVSNQVHATYTSISPTVTSNHSHLPSYDAMLTNTTVLSRHTFHLSISTSIQRHSSFKPTVQARKQRGNQSLWVWLKPSLARGSGPLWQSKSQRPHSSSINLTIGFYSKAGHRGMWPSVITCGRLAAPTSQQWLASEVGSWSWTLLDPYRGYRSCCIHHWNAHAAQKQRHRPGQSLSLPSSTGWETIGQDLWLAWPATGWKLKNNYFIMFLSFWLPQNYQKTSSVWEQLSFFVL